MKNCEIPLLPGVCYHIYNHANGFEKLFKNPGNYTYFLNKYIEHVSHVADTQAYCLMPNHIHFMVRIKPQSQLPNDFTSKKISKAFGNFFSAYAQAFNKQQKRMGGLFIPNFKRKIVADSAYYQNLVRYIHLNPVEARLVAHVAAWPHSSFLSHLSHHPTRLLRQEVLEQFGGKTGFVQAHHLKIDDQFLKLVAEWPME